jgi:hypothetical protein
MLPLTFWRRLSAFFMKKWRERLVVSCVLVLVGSYAWVHRPHVAPATSVQESVTLPRYAEQEQAAQSVSVSGPLADYMSRVKAAGVETLQPISSTVLQSGSRRTVVSDHVTDDSPVGTSTPLLHRTFNVTRIVDLPFDLPAHASMPKLRGTYRSFVSGNGAGQAGTDDSGVEFLLLNEQQFTDLINGRPSDALFSADDAANGEVNFTMPPTFGKPAKYHLVFRNSSPSSGKRAVQADFHIDF